MVPFPFQVRVVLQEAVEQLFGIELPAAHFRSGGVGIRFLLCGRHLFLDKGIEPFGVREHRNLLLPAPDKRPGVERCERHAAQVLALHVERKPCNLSQPLCHEGVGLLELRQHHYAHADEKAQPLARGGDVCGVYPRACVHHLAFELFQPFHRPVVAVEHGKPRARAQ